MGMKPPRSTARAFTYYADAPPTVTKASPAYGDLAKPPPYVQLAGRGFAPLGAKLTCAFGEEGEEGQVLLPACNHVYRPVTMCIGLCNGERPGR